MASKESYKSVNLAKKTGKDKNNVVLCTVTEVLSF